MTGQSKGLFSYGLFVHACAGSAASCVALTFAFPFLTLVQRRQRKLKLNTYQNAKNVQGPNFSYCFS
jgi:hypothetical protein